jgi:hypothetical protein
MTSYYQETDAFVLPKETTYSVPFGLANETYGGGFELRYIPLVRRSNLIRPALKIIQNVANQNIAMQAKDILFLIQESVNAFSQQSNIDLSFLPPLQAFDVVDDGSILIEWIFDDFRIGFNLESNFQDSGWFLVSNKNLGEIGASGYTSGINTKTLISWLLNFVISNS